jgi:tetratricopeptide (TPR) repeat protein
MKCFLKLSYFLVPAALALAPAHGSAQSSSPVSPASPASPACIPREVVSALSACDVSLPRAAPGPTGAAPRSPHALPPAADPPKAASPPTPGADPAEIRTLRARLAAPRVKRLLLTELGQLEDLFKATSRSAADRPVLLRRLADTYVELESAAQREQTEAEVAHTRPEADAARKIVEASRQSAIKYYALLASDHPTYPQLDEALYYLAFEHEQAQKLDEARKVYFQLIGAAPQSRFVPNAYLAFGELFFTEAQSDPSKLELARQSYLKVLEYPESTNKTWGYAQYKLAYVHWNLGQRDDLMRAMDAFKKVIEWGDRHASEPGASSLQKVARKDLVPVYALTGKPSDAHAFFSPISGDQAGTGGQGGRGTFSMMNDLGEAYLDTGHYAEAITLYEDLAARDKGDASCRYQAQIVRATMALKGGAAKPAVHARLTELSRRRRAFQAESHDAAAKLACSSQTAELLYETAASWHLEAQGSGGVRGTSDPTTMKLASGLYGTLIEGFSREAFSRLEFPRLAREDWPSLSRIKYNLADLLYVQGDWAGCGAAFDAVVDDDPRGPDAAEAAFTSVLCYQKLYDRTHTTQAARHGTGNLPGAQAPGATAAQLAHKAEFTPTQKGMLASFSRYLCVVKPAENDARASDQVVEVKFARARLYFEAHRWEESAAAFRDIAFSHPDHDAAPAAAQLYLEAANILATSADPPRAACIDEMAASVPRLVALECDGARSARNQQECATLARVQGDLEQLGADARVKEADRGGDGALRKYEEAAGMYLSLARRCALAPIEEGRAPTCDKPEVLIWNAAEAYGSARLIMKSIQARKLLLDPKYKLEKTDVARRSVSKIGGAFQAIAVYDEAARWYERYARDYPTAEKAEVALSDAIVLRFGLGQDDEAQKDVELFAATYGASKAAETARVAFASAAHNVNREEWDLARKQLQGAMPLIDGHAQLDVQTEAHAMLGRALVSLARHTAADGEYRKVLSLWKDPRAASDRVTKGDEQGGQRRLGRALSALGEARFHFAEKEGKKANAVRFPAYNGPAEKTAVLRHIDTKVRAWLRGKKSAIELAEKEYLRVLEITPSPPPPWVVASGARVGAMWGDFVREFRASPIPDEIRRDDELRNAYYEALDRASEPQKQRAKAAFEACLKYAVNFQFFDGYSRSCEVWLSANYKGEYHQLDELRGAPVFSGSGLNDRPYPVDLGGASVSTAPPSAR